MPLLTTILPSNVMMVFNLIMPVVMFDLLDQPGIKDYQPSAWLTFDWDRQRELESEIFAQTRDLGYESHN